MEQIKTKIKKWGNSFGIILPKDFINKEKLGEGESIEIAVKTKNKQTVGEVFDLAKKNQLPKLKKSTDELVKEIDEELWEIKR